MDNFQATHVTLNEILAAREHRAAKQAELLRGHNAPLVCFTMNVAGPVKTSPLIEIAFREGAKQITAALEENYTIIHHCEEFSKCGAVAYYSVSGDASAIKASMERIEDTHPIGRFFDIDVLRTDGQKLSRKNERGCFVCGAAGRACAAGRLHPVEVLTHTTNTALTQYFLRTDPAKAIAVFAVQALLDEAYTAPKPGLVDPMTRGSHTDMDLSSFERSAYALQDYFEQCVVAGMECKNESHSAFFARLQALGLKAERSMMRATGGVNTHKGAIFTFGLLTGASGRLLSPHVAFPNTTAVLEEAALIARPAMQEHFLAAHSLTAGEQAYTKHGIRGIRGEAMDGFPSLRSTALPAYREARAQGKNKNDAGLLALLHLIANVDDTTLIHRGGMDGLRYAQAYARTLLSSQGVTHENLIQMDADFTARNLSSGGCADLLAATYFLTALEDTANP